MPGKPLIYFNRERGYKREGRCDLDDCLLRSRLGDRFDRALEDNQGEIGRPRIFREACGLFNLDGNGKLHRLLFAFLCDPEQHLLRRRGDYRGRDVVLRVHVIYEGV